MAKKKFKVIVWQKVWNIYEVRANDEDEAMELAIEEHMDASLNDMNAEYPKAEIRV